MCLLGLENLCALPNEKRCLAFEVLIGLLLIYSAVDTSTDIYYIYTQRTI